MNKPVATSEQEIAAALRLRQNPVPVTRLSRKVLIGLGAASSVAIVAAVAWAMGNHGASAAKPELYATDSKARPDGLAALPKDYSTASPGAPKLGPPLPGDLGRPILNASQGGVSGPGSGVATGAAQANQPDPAKQQLAQEGESARTSHLFAGDSNGGGTGSGPALMASAALPVPGPTPGAPATGAPGMQDRKAAFLNGRSDHQTVSDERLQAPPSPYVVQAGSVIPAALVTGIRSDLPGQVIAQVSQNVYDSPTGKVLLIPQGSKLIGTYDSQVAFGQRRALLAWTRLILPGGQSIILDRQPAADPQGYAGLEDGVNNHWGQLFSAALVSTLLGVGADVGVGQNSSDPVQAFRFGFASSINQAGQQVVGRSLQVQPTLTIRPGSPVRVMVTRDLVLQPFPT
jgi:type IV secretion system protein VirB10